MLENRTPFTLASSQTTAGSAEEALLLSENGAAPAATIPVPTGTRMVITDITVAALGATARFKLQYETSSGFFTIGTVIIPGVVDEPLVTVNVGTGWVITGGPLVAARMRVRTLGGALPVAATLNGYRES